MFGNVQKVIIYHAFNGALRELGAGFNNMQNLEKYQ